MMKSLSMLFMMCASSAYATSCTATLGELDLCTNRPLCCGTGLRCYEFNVYYAQCLKTCTYTSSATCKDLTSVYGTPEPTPAPTYATRAPSVYGTPTAPPTYATRAPSVYGTPKPTPAPTEIQRLPEVRCMGGATVKISVTTATVEVAGILTMTTRVYAFDGVPALPGTTIYMKAGEQCNLEVTNNLEGEACSTEAPVENAFHCPDMTSLHTHGLHVSPNEDNIDTHIVPNGGSHTYTYNLPADHLMGTHWYHAHHHGSTTLQAMGGMAGILIVEPHDDYELPEDVRALYRRDSIPPLMLNFFNFAGPPLPGVFGFLDHSGLVESYANVTVPLNLKFADDNAPRRFFTVNAQFNPTITMNNADATLLRISNAGDWMHLSLKIEDDDGECSMTLLARDGVFHKTPYLDIGSINLHQGTRADVVVYCNLLDPTQEKVFTVAASNTSRVMATLTNIMVQESVFKLRVVPAAYGVVRLPVPSSAVPFPPHFDDLTKLEADQYQVGGERGVTDIIFGIEHPTDGDDTINGATFPGWNSVWPERYVEEYCLDKVYETTLGAATPNEITSSGAAPHAISRDAFHPYHQHVNHFQIIQGHDDSGEVVRNGEWRDTVPAWGTVMRFKPDQFTGDVVFHCHLLQHEDLGMMGLQKVSNCGNSVYN